jgi:hypothetical protein
VVQVAPNNADGLTDAIKFLDVVQHLGSMVSEPADCGRFLLKSCCRMRVRQDIADRINEHLYFAGIKLEKTDRLLKGDQICERV